MVRTDTLMACVGKVLASATSDRLGNFLKTVTPSLGPVQQRVVTAVTLLPPANGASPRVFLAEATARWNENAKDQRKDSVVVPFGFLVPP